MKVKKIMLALIGILATFVIFIASMNQATLAALGDSNVIKIRGEEKVTNLTGGAELHEQAISALKDGQGNYYYDYNAQWLTTAPNGEGTKIVSWSYKNPNKWQMAGVTEIAKDFEKHNPGWIVVGGVNADFFRITGNGQMDSNACENGEIIMARNVTANEWWRGIIGFDSNNQLITGIPEMTSSYNLHVFNGKDLKDEKNSIPVVFNPSSIDANALTVITKDAEQYYDLTGFKVLVGQYDIVRVTEDWEKEYFVKGTILSKRDGTINERPVEVKEVEKEDGTKTNESVREFYLVTKNEDAFQNIEINDYVSCHKDYINRFADVQQAVSYWWKIVDNGTVMFEGHTDANKRAEIIEKYGQGMSDISYATCTKARCLFGIKADGSYVMTVIDGTSSTGMTLSEAGVFMKEIGCVNAWNFDGGGSATLVARLNEKIETINVPSDAGDGTERRVGNALLMVARDPGYSVNTNETSVSSITVNKKTGEVYENVKNVTAVINGKEYKIEDNQTTVTFTGLEENTEYTITFKFQIDGIDYSTDIYATTKVYDPGVDINPTSNGFTIGLRQTNENLITSKITLLVEGNTYVIENKEGTLEEYNINDLYKGETYRISYTYEVTIKETGKTYTREVETKAYQTLNYYQPVIKAFTGEIKRGKINVEFEIEDSDQLISKIVLLDNGEEKAIALTNRKYVVEDDKKIHTYQLIIEYVTPDEKTKQIESKTIEVGQHTESDWIVDKEATCKEEGKRHTECTDCHIVLEEEVIPKKEHTWKDATTEAPKTCTICGATEGEKLPGVKNNCKGCKKSSIAIILSGISLLCASIYLIRRKK